MDDDVPGLYRDEAPDFGGKLLELLSPHSAAAMPSS